MVCSIPSRRFFPSTTPSTPIRPSYQRRRPWRVRTAPCIGSNVEVLLADCPSLKVNCMRVVNRLVYDGASQKRRLAELPAQDFAEVGLRQGLAAELDDLGHLVAGQVLPTMFEQGLFSERRILPHHDDLDDLAGLVVSCAYRPDLGHTRMQRDDVFDLVREDLEAGDHDDVLLAVRDSEVAALVHEPHIAGAQPAVAGENLFGLIGMVPVLPHDLRAAHADLSNLADREFVVALVED